MDVSSEIFLTSSVTCLSSNNVFILLRETICWLPLSGAHCIFDEMLAKCQVWGQGTEGVLDSFVDRVMNVRCLTCGYKF